MKIIIIEDEKLTAEDLADAIRLNEPEAEIIATLTSVQEGIDFFQGKVEADLIFSDIQLGDGLSFEIFRKTKCDIPVIFCTAYDEYALTAFETNSIDYVLKPFSSKVIRETLTKYKNLKKAFSPVASNLEELLMTLDSKSKVNSVLVHYRGQIIPIPLADIAFIYIHNEVCLLKTFDNKTYILNKTLDEFDQKLGSNFFRANRQYLVNRTAVKSVENYGARKLALVLAIPHDTVITVSKEKHTPLMNWLEG
jgi:two-component system response regulator LytT